MGETPAEIFHRFFKNETNPQYRGRNDLSSLQTSVRSQLLLIQETFHFALQNENQGIPEHVDHPPFHLDYVDADVKGAHAFQIENNSFIAITVPLIFSISDLCLRLSKSTEVARLLAIAPSDEDYNALHAILFSIMIAFITAHEYTHHVYGHVADEQLGMLPMKTLAVHVSRGDFKQQVEEIVADGYSVHHLLQNYFQNSDGLDISTILMIDPIDTVLYDQIVVGILIVALGGYFLSLGKQDLSLLTIYGFSHPPHAARMNFLMQEVVLWSERKRPGLEAFVKRAFQPLMNAAALATLGGNAQTAWTNETAFLQSEPGETYMAALIRSVNDYKDRLKAKAQVSA